MTTKHALRYDGAPHDESGSPMNGDKKTTSGEGRALCSCGWLSDSMSSGRARKLAFSIHKENPEPGGEAPTPEPVEEKTTEEKRESAKAAHPAAQRKKTAPKKPETIAEPDEPEARETVTFNLARHFFKAAGDEGSLILATAFGAEAAPRPGYLVEIYGDAEPVAKMASELPWIWLGSKEPFRLWKRSDEKYLGMNKRTKWGSQDAYELEQKWFRGFFQGVADAMTDSVSGSTENAIYGYSEGVMFIENDFLELVENDGEDLL